MARLTKQVLGRVSGKVGDIQFRQRNGKNIVGLNPESFIPGTDDESVARRARFATTVKFSQAVYSLDSLKDFWKKDKPEGLSAFNYVFRKNYKYIQSDLVTASAVIVPEYGFGVTASAVNVTPSSITVDINAVGHDNNIDSGSELNCLLTAVIFLSNPLSESVDPYSFIYLSSSSQPLDLDTALNFSITPTSSLQQLALGYQNSTGFFSLVTIGNDSLPVHYSTTFIS